MKKRLINLARKTRIGRFIISVRLIPCAKKTVIRFMGKSHAKNKSLIWDVAKTQASTSFGMSEYFWYGFSNKTIKERHEFVSDSERVTFSEKVNPAKNAEIFNNKGKTYEYFKDFFKRNVCCISNNFETDIDKFKEFLKSADGKFIVKTLEGSFGKDVKIFSYTENDSAEQLLETLNNEYNCKLILEEVIVQDARTAVFHPQSLNSVRIPTIRFPDGTTEVIYPFFRVGRGDSVVDNAGAGGIICSIDPISGEIIATADEHCKSYEVHPETNQQLIGFTIPCWNEAVEFAKQLAQVLPDNVYSAWDIALTDNGWVMVEGNYRGQFVWQIPTQRGFRNEMEEIIQKLDKQVNAE